MIYDLQKASILKRISAFLLDFILICILAVGFAALISVIVDYDGKVQVITDTRTKYEKEYNLAEYDISLTTSKTEISKLSQQAQDAYNKANKAFQAEVKDVSFELFGIVFLMISLGLFFAHLILEFLLPLLVFKNGQTVGKKIFGVGVMLISGVRISPVALFVRAMLGKYAVETMVPVSLAIMFLMFPDQILFLIFCAFFLLQLILIIATKNNALIHDILSSTVAVDMSTQMMFDSYDDLVKYKEEVHQQQVENQKS